MHVDTAAIDRLIGSMNDDVSSGLYDGGVVLVARGGEVACHEPVGFSDRAAGRKSRTDDVFRIFSTTKAFTNLLVLKAFDRGLLSPTTKVAEIIPEFLGADRFRSGLKAHVNVQHLMTHRAGLSPTPWPVPPLQAGDLDRTIAAICEMDLVAAPGERMSYSPCLSHALLGELVRRTLGGGRSFTRTLHEELLDPLGMRDTEMGAPSAWADRLVPVVPKFPPGGFFSPADITDTAAAAYEGAELPWVGCVSTVADLFRFTEMLRRDGELDGVRIVSPAVLDLARRNHTGDLLNDRYARLTAEMHWDPWVANVGLGFMLRGPGLHQTFFGTTASPGTYGNYGAGSSQFFVDPVRDLTFVCLTAGVLGEADNTRRFQRLSDMALAAAV
ncbi:serine hydrolase domain-containing protein [Streptomyces sp. NPDC057257]|uniref:serine hydrolase domain-containing protein n=1 Tax=Streptomyces sp. NPDC057257 TaxID=3346071 RepID=UPI0036269A98